MKFNFLSIDWSAKPNRRERILFGAVILVICTGSLRACVVPSVVAVGTLQSEIRRLQGQQVGLSLIANIPVARRAPQSPFIGAADEVESASKKLTDPAWLAGARVIKSSFPPMRRSGDLYQQEVELELAGGFSSIGRYVEKVEGGRAPLFIDSLTLHIDKERPQLVLATIKGNVYGAP